MAATTEIKTVAGDPEWSNLPHELLSLITNHHLHSATIHILRIRATCTSWRSAIPLRPSPSHTVFGPWISIRWSNYTFIQTSVFYRLQYQPSSTSSSPKGWLIMVRNSTSNPVQLLDPFTNKPLSGTGTHPYDRTTPLKLLNLSNFSLVQLFESISRIQTHHQDMLSLVEDLRLPYRPSDFFKVILFPSLTCQTFDESSSRMVFALDRLGRLSVSRIDEDEDLTTLDGGDFVFHDVILYNGQIYAVDERGTIFWVNCSTLKLVQFSPILSDFHQKMKRLVECNGSLYVVDIDIFDGRIYEEDIIKVYKLDVDHGWLHVETLDNLVLVLGASCSFSLSVEDYYGCDEANCIYLHYNQRIRAFNLKTAVAPLVTQRSSVTTLHSLACALFESVITLAPPSAAGFIS
ncbi:hypothetical protein PIB30_009741 [Stylosanthes scabra]|uniref:KIB1-4 beta-propeller domain-containing protein n=1 Tax=Stylosanthes scabra TaxID=79078 RepID=A0ABU6W3C8_9FABA|nr:hypothetical protein [Stylosanthes scabra]